VDTGSLQEKASKKQSGSDSMKTGRGSKFARAAEDRSHGFLPGAGVREVVPGVPMALQDFAPDPRNVTRTMQPL
jgi:hypothetical protein